MDVFGTLSLESSFSIGGEETKGSKDGSVLIKGPDYAHPAWEEKRAFLIRPAMHEEEQARCSEEGGNPLSRSLAIRGGEVGITVMGGPTSRESTGTLPRDQFSLSA